jgi:hypothetical protein
MTPIRANIVGPPDVATRIRASIAACHSGASCSPLRKLGDEVAGIFQSDERPSAGKWDQIVEGLVSSCAQPSAARTGLCNPEMAQNQSEHHRQGGKRKPRRYAKQDDLEMV